MFIDSMQVLAEHGVDRCETHVQPNKLQNPEFGVSIQIRLDDNLDKILQIF